MKIGRNLIDDQQTPLHAASINNRTAIVRYLVSKGANPLSQKHIIKSKHSYFINIFNKNRKKKKFGLFFMILLFITLFKAIFKLI